jgi:hypothetical protein
MTITTNSRFLPSSQSLRASLVVALATACLGTGVAHAQKKVPARTAAAPATAPTAPHPSPKVRSLAETLPKEAKSEYDDAFVLVRNGDFKGALAKFDSAYAKFSDPRLLWNMATCEKNLQHYGKSLTLVRRYIEEGKSLLTPTDVQDAAAIEDGLASLTTTLKLVVKTPAAKVSIDGEPVDASKPILVNVGEHTVTAKKDDFVDFLSKVSGPGKSSIEVVIELQPVAHEARLVVKASTSDSIAIDGKVVGTGTFSGTVKSGGHTVKVTAPGRVAYEKEITLRDHENRDMSVTLEEKKGSILPWVLVGAGVVAAAGAATGIYFVAKPGREDGVPQGSLPPNVVNTSYRF